MKRLALLLIGVLMTGLLPLMASETLPPDDLMIQQVFERYGKKRNVTMVELSNEMLETYNMTHYQSIVIKGDAEALRFVRQCLASDQKEAKKIKEVTDDGGVVSAYYQLPGKDELNRFILFKVSTKGVITLVYMEGDLESDDLITILFSK
jgi:predicted transcriptional regulator